MAGTAKRKAPAPKAGRTTSTRTSSRKRKAPEKTANGAKPDDEKKEKEPSIDWTNSAAKLFLKKAFKEELIPLKYMRKEGGPGPRFIWDKFCAGTPAFNRMQYGSRFTSRLATVRNDHYAKASRSEIDQNAYDNFRQRHPRPTHDHKGLPLWDGSDAQRLLKEDMANGLHEKGDPIDLWVERAEYQVYDLQVFRDHIYQEQKLWKLHNWLQLEEEKKKKVIPDKKPAPPENTENDADSAASDNSGDST